MPATIEGKDIIVIGIQPWDYHIGSNCKNIALEFSRNNRVLYVNQPLDRITRLRSSNTEPVKKRLEIIKGKKNGLEEVSENLWVYYPATMVESINKLPDGSIYDYLNKRNNKFFAKEILNAVQELNFKDYILFNDSLMFLGYYLNELLRPVLSIYYTRDNLISQPYFRKHGQRMEPALASRYDGIVSNSIYLANLLKEANPHAYMVGQGCDLSLFKSSKDISLPDDLDDIPRPIVGYVGFLTDMRLDIELLVDFAKDNQELSLVLVGPEDPAFEQSELHRLKNVYFLGSKSEAELPIYINGFDVAINPQKVNEMTIGNYPRKIDEYLAMGKPTVATKTETMDYFKDHVYLSTDSKDFGRLVKLAISENSSEKELERIQFASNHTWENNVENIYKVMEKIMTQSNQ